MLAPSFPARNPEKITREIGDPLTGYPTPVENPFS